MAQAKKPVISYEFQNPLSQMTLREGLMEYYRLHPEYDGDGPFLAQPRENVKAHDVCHIVFGLGTTSADELIVEVMTALGCYLPLKHVLKAPKYTFAIELIKHFGLWSLLHRFFMTIPRMARASFLALRMKKRWPHFAYETYLDIPLYDIRQEFGIRMPL